MFLNQKQNKKINEVTTIIGADTTIEGRLHIDSSIRIDGNVYGDIRCAGDVTIGKDGYVEKGVIARNVYIAGTAKGNMRVENKIHIYNSGYLDGIAEMKTIIIDENGRFHGKSLMKDGTRLATKPKVIDIDKEKDKAKAIEKEKAVDKDNLKTEQS